MVVISSLTDCHIGLQNLKTFSMVVRLSSWSPINTPRCHRQHRGAKDWVVNSRISKSSQNFYRKTHALSVRKLLQRSCEIAKGVQPRPGMADQRFNSQQYESLVTRARGVDTLRIDSHLGLSGAVCLRRSRVCICFAMESNLSIMVLIAYASLLQASLISSWTSLSTSILTPSE